MKVCLNCGDKLLDKAKKCPTCGKNVFQDVDKSDAQTIAKIQQEAPNPKDGLRPKWMDSHAISSIEKNNRIQENKKNGVACCPKCGSISLSASKQGIGIGKAAVGVWALGPIGAAAGAIGAKKTHVTCLNCGNKWKL